MGLGTFGRPDVERVLEILRTETRPASRLAGQTLCGEMAPLKCLNSAG
jgi:hypothetical protein